MLKQFAKLLALAALALSLFAKPVHVSDFPAEQPNEYAACDGTSEILDLIGKTEGTDRGRGYNETLAYGAFTGGSVELLHMTLAEIDALQTSMLKHPANKLHSSALGRYQIVRTTLRGLRKELGLSGQEYFTAGMQDKLAIALINRRGFRAWKAGLISDRKFQFNLSLEWASLTNPYTGRGSYAGQNAKVKISVQQAALERARCE